MTTASLTSTKGLMGQHNKKQVFAQPQRTNTTLGPVAPDSLTEPGPSVHLVPTEQTVIPGTIPEPPKPKQLHFTKHGVTVGVQLCTYLGEGEYVCFCPTVVQICGAGPTPQAAIKDWAHHYAKYEEVAVEEFRLKLETGIAQPTARTLAGRAPPPSEAGEDGRL